MTPSVGQNIDTSTTTEASWTLPSYVYTDPEVFQRERSAIHFRSWHYAGTTQQLAKPGSYLTARLLDQSIIVIRDKEETIRGFHNVCQHRAHELLRGHGHVNLITCPYHAWTYAIDGRFRGGRGAAAMAECDSGSFDLKTVRVEILADRFIFFNLDPDAMPLHEQAGGLEAELRAEVPEFERLVVASSPGTADIKANWKVTVDNYLECYHCKVAHPAFADMIDMQSFRVVTHPYWMSHKANLGREDNSAYRVHADAVNRKALFWWLWPTTTFNVLPGSPELSVFSFMPTTVTSTLQWGQRFALAGDERDEGREGYRNGRLTDEDVAIVESVQRGLSSRGYTAGPFVHDSEGRETSEAAVQHFHGLVREALGLA
jgi:carnitine monooxygenase subunit